MPRVISSLLLVSLFLLAGSQQQGITMWVTGSLERVLRTAAPGSNQNVVLYAARGEVQSFQLAFRSDLPGATISSVTLSDFTAGGGLKIASQQAALFRECFVQVFPNSPFYGGSNPPEPAGFYPDALIPFVDPMTGKPPEAASIRALPVTLNPGQAQPFWIDISVPRDAAPGTYKGQYAAATNYGTFSGEVVLQVWRFTLPLKPSLKSSFGVWSHNAAPIDQELLANKLAPSHVALGHERDFIDQNGLSLTGLGFFSGANFGSCSMEAPPPVSAILERAIQHSPALMIYNYTADEIDHCPNLTQPLRAWARNLHQAGVRNLVTMTPRADLLDDGLGQGRSAVDIWVMLPVMFDQAGPALQAARAKGDQIWSYNGLAQEGYSPKWLLDYPPIDFRIQPGFMSQSLGLTGLLYWRVDEWTSDPWRNVNNIGKFGNYNAPGEGMLVYPGAEVGLQGVAPSMRLKWLRDGVQDYEYVELFKARGRGDWAVGQASSIAGDWRRWSHSAADLERVRLTLGQELDQIGEPALANARAIKQ